MGRGYGHGRWWRFDCGLLGHRRNGLLLEVQFPVPDGQIAQLHAVRLEVGVEVIHPVGDLLAQTRDRRRIDVELAVLNGAGDRDSEDPPHRYGHRARDRAVEYRVTRLVRTQGVPRIG